MNSTIRLTKPGTTMIVAKPAAKGYTGKYDYNVLFIKKPGNYLLPATKLQAVDQDVKWKNLLGDYTPSMIKLEKAHDETSNVELPSVEDTHFKIGGMRALFQKTGILLANHKEDQTSSFANWQGEVEKDASKFLEMCTQMNLHPQINQLHPWSHWVSTKDNTNILFFLTLLDDKTPVANATDINWTNPETALNSHANRKFGLPPLEWFMIHEMQRYTTVDSLMNSAKLRKLGDTVKPARVITIPDAGELQKGYGLTLPDYRVLSSVLRFPAEAFVGDLVEGSKPQPKSLLITIDAERPLATDRYSYKFSDKIVHKKRLIK